MGVKTHPTFTVTCDRCGFSTEQDWNPVDHPDRSEWEFWRRYNERGGWAITQRLLCAMCSDKLNLFLDGEKTPVSVTFNRHEYSRYEATKNQRAGVGA